ncbi:hypothetical protein SAMN05192533_10524 [Mesobacillus persicus]|uniref:Uncharacterized protein n=1 Tax=Mesobacillus persicus TaxID=930146 RepID=A0A1H8AHY5_9BACI|nr:hypothetical protein SAMN05192533_10524 [Mesobacillus persicus]
MNGQVTQTVRSLPGANPCVKLKMSFTNAVKDDHKSNIQRSHQLLLFFLLIILIQPFLKQLKDEIMLGFAHRMIFDFV